MSGWPWPMPRLLAGVAFANSMCGVVHALAHATGGQCHVPHGVANSILLPYGLEFYIRKSPETEKRIGKLLRFLTTPEDYAKVPAVIEVKARWLRYAALPAISTNSAASL